MNPVLSIIIPCYNSESTLDTTLQSVINQNFQDWEAIIVNDGSTDSTEKIALKWVNKDNRFKFFSKQNEGLGKTRNYGISRAKGIYILPLDSDNQLVEDFSQDAIDVFDKNKEVGVVYGDAEYFGERVGIWKVQEFDLKTFLYDNYIDACAIYKKKIWEEIGGYDENMPFQGNEDWELWLAFGRLEVNFYHLNKITFKYFVSNASMIRSFTTKMHQTNKDYIFNKYSGLYQKYYSEFYLLYNKSQKQYYEKLQSEKFVIDLFCSTFFGFSIFGLYKKNKM